MFGDPDFFTIEQNKQMGLWPPSDIAGLGIAPYINKFKKDKVFILDLGPKKGENAAYILEKCPNAFIMLGPLDDKYADILKENLKSFGDRVLIPNVSNIDAWREYKFRHWDVICVGESVITEIENQKDDLIMPQSLAMHFKEITPGGFLCGNEHHLTHVKLALADFRKETKAGPILVSNGSWLVYKR